MEDKDLDKYFKDRSGAFNEVPGEGLWAKIESNITPVPSGFKAGKWLLPGAGAVICIGIVAAWLITGNKEQIPAPKQPQQITTNKGSVEQTVQDTVTHTGNNSITATPATKRFDRIQMPNSITDTIAPVIGDTKGETATAVAPDSTTEPHQPDAEINETVKPRKGKDQIEITVTEKLTRTERNTLINSTIEKNATYVGRKIVIKAKGYRIYRHTITDADFIKYGGTRDSLPTQNLKLTVVTDTVFYDLKYDSPGPEILNFEVNPKTLKKE